MLNLPLINLLLIINDIHLCEDTDHAKAIFRIGLLTSCGEPWTLKKLLI